MFNVENFIYLYSNSFSTVMVVCTPYVTDRHTVLDRQKIKTQQIDIFDMKKYSTDRLPQHKEIFNKQTCVID
jgi:hypothetical protein